MTGTFPKLNGIVLTFVEEKSQFAKDSHQMQLKWVCQTIENVFCWVNKIGDNDDFWDVVFVARLVDATSYGKKFSLRTCDKYSMVDCFGEGEVGLMYMHNRSSNVVFDASISYNDSRWGRGVWEDQVVEFLSMGDVFFLIY